MTNKPTKPLHLFFGSLFGFTAVLLGAFGVHALKEVLSPEQLESFQTGVRYQMYHALLLIMISLKGHHFQLKLEKWIVTLIGIGVVLFSGSIYLLNIQEITGFDFKPFAIIKPLGGLLLISAWALMIVDASRLLLHKEKR